MMFQSEAELLNYASEVRMLVRLNEQSICTDENHCTAQAKAELHPLCCHVFPAYASFAYVLFACSKSAPSFNPSLHFSLSFTLSLSVWTHKHVHAHARHMHSCIMMHAISTITSGQYDICN